MFILYHQPAGPHPLVQGAENVLHDNTASKAVTFGDVFALHDARQAVRDVLRNFYYTNRQNKERRTLYFLNKAFQDRIASEERKYVSGRSDVKKKPAVCTVLCIGTAGTGVGSRITGHARRGGEQFRRRHRRYVTVSMTNEYRSSQTCSTCFQPVTHPRVLKFKKGEWKTVTDKGSSLCMNPTCPTYIAGTNTKNRDEEAAECIAIAGARSLLTGITLPPFEYASQFDTGTQFPTYHSPPVTGIQIRLLLDIMRYITKRNNI